MSWALFLDDERFPPDTGQVWRIARNVDQAFAMIDEYGMPSHMSLDHDLGEGELTGLDFVKALINDFFEYQVPPEGIPIGFTFYVHSQNPVGAENIRSLLGDFIRFWRAE